MAAYLYQGQDLLVARSAHGVVAVLLWMRLLEVWRYNAGVGPLIIIMKVRSSAPRGRAAAAAEGLTAPPWPRPPSRRRGGTTRGAGAEREALVGGSAFVFGVSARAAAGCRRPAPPACAGGGGRLRGARGAGGAEGEGKAPRERLPAPLSRWRLRAFSSASAASWTLCRR